MYTYVRHIYNIYIYMYIYIYIYIYYTYRSKRGGPVRSPPEPLPCALSPVLSALARPMGDWAKVVASAWKARWARTRAWRGYKDCVLGAPACHTQLDILFPVARQAGSHLHATGSHGPAHSQHAASGHCQ